MMTMKKKSQAEVNPLSALSDKKLLSELKRADAAEHEAMLSVLGYLVEIERRRLYLTLGYSSLFEFALRYLGYSESAAARRIRVARCMREFPEVEGLLREKKLTLSTLSKLRGVITEANKDQLLAMAVGSSSREVDEIVARLRPSYRVPDRVRPVFVIRGVKESDRTGTGGGINEEGGREFTADVGGKKSASLRDRGIVDEASGEGLGEGCCGGSCEGPGSGACGNDNEGPGSGPCSGASDLCGEGSSNDPKDRSSRPSPSRAEVERRFKLEFAVSGSFMEKLERVRELLSSSHPAGMGFEDVFGTLIDEYIERHSPESRIRRRTERRERARRRAEHKDKERRKDESREKARRRDGSADSSTSGGVRDSGTAGSGERAPRSSGVEKPLTKNPRSRHIPRAVRDEVWARDGGRCAYVSPAGVRCTSRWNLEIDHVVPFARGGNSDSCNLRLLCSKHNRMEAERAYGRDHMKRFYKDR